MAMVASILWCGVAFPGHEFCRLVSQASAWHLEGTAVFSHEGQPARLDYQVVCDSAWQTVSARVTGWLGRRVIDLQVKTNSDGHWWLNTVEQPNVQGCTDIDLNFSPSTNLLPIRRLNLGIGQSAAVKAAWLRFPDFELASLPQLYRRLDEHTYQYESTGGQFVAELKVNHFGFVTGYSDLWQAEAFSE